MICEISRMIFIYNATDPMVAASPTILITGGTDIISSFLSMQNSAKLFIFCSFLSEFELDTFQVRRLGAGFTPLLPVLSVGITGSGQ